MTKKGKMKKKKIVTSVSYLYGEVNLKNMFYTSYHMYLVFSIV